MPVMTEKKKPGRPSKSAAPLKILHVKLDSDLRAALDACVKRTMPRTSVTGVVEAALKGYLEEHGYWPLPSAPPSQPPDEEAE